MGGAGGEVGECTVGASGGCECGGCQRVWHGGGALRVSDETGSESRIGSGYCCSERSRSRAVQVPRLIRLRDLENRGVEVFLRGRLPGCTACV